jgi:3-oxoadipate enol-lactonase
MATLSIRGARLEMEELGSVDATRWPLIWGHGLSSSRADEDVEPLVDMAVVARDGRRVVRYDARGHGESESTADLAGYGWDQLALDQLALADTLGIEPYVAGGASMGAATALHAAVRAPERIVGLLLVIPPTAWETRAEQTDMYRQMADVVEARGVEPLVAGAAMLPPPDPYLGRPEVRERRADSLRANDPERLARVFRGAATTDLPDPELVARIDVPSLILAWTGDPGHPVSTAERLHELLPRNETSLASTASELATWTDRVAGFLGALDGHRAG